MKKIEAIGAKALNAIAGVGKGAWLVLNGFILFFNNKRNWQTLIHQISFAGIMSLPLIAMSAVFIGMVFTIQSYWVLESFGAASEVGLVLGLSVFRELGPVITALLYTGRVGSSITAELGLMKTSEQFASMELMSVDPISRIVGPRLVAMVITLPLLTMFFNWVALLGSAFVAGKLIGLDSGTFWSNLKNGILFYSDVLPGLFKSVIFGLIIASVSLYHGYFGDATPSGVAKNSTRTVVQGSMLVLIFDYILVALMR
ncbi:MAG: MlaE family lipid ABC transporter permease subunit [Gammaproteobacteria bacterium]|nr:MlaE family lipid ABC transporter permease subunit [Gammaproteobacteria bacterium]